MEEEVRELIQEDFDFELFLSTDGKHTVHVKAQTAEGRKHAFEYAKQVYDHLESTYGKKGVSKHTTEFESSLFPSDNCPVHGVSMFSAVSKKTGKPYKYHKSEDGAICFGRGYQEKK